MQDDSNSSDNTDHRLLPHHGKVVQPLTDDLKADQKSKDKSDPAVELLLNKIDKLYTNEPDAKEELEETEHMPGRRSKHQQFMHELSNSGKSLAEIQTAWHAYYVGLPDEEKHEVWHEFYSNHERASRLANRKPEPKQTEPAEAKNKKVTHGRKIEQQHDARTAAEVRNQLLSKVQKRTNVKKGSRGHSLLFGLGMGAIISVIFLFGFFNERFIAPFITPSRAVSNTPIIIDPSGTAVGPESKIIIPKINLEIPVIYDEPSIEEAAVQKALERGVLHYATTPNPGELGNGVVFGHSSNNILNKGKYKFAFVLLKQLEPGDTFMLQKDGKRYIYKVYEKKIVKPEDVSVLNNTSKPATFTLITCDPPGTSVNRLVVIGEQISPDPKGNVASTVKQDTSKPATLPGDAQSLWQRFTNWLTF
jgi:sortase A